MTPRRRARSPQGGDGPTTPATLALDRAGVAYRRHAYDHDPATDSYGLDAAAALQVEPARVFKTLLVEKADAGLAVAIVPVTGQLDLKAVAAALGTKAVSMATPAAAERSTGYVVGGISPIGQKRTLPTVLDEGALEFDTVFVSGGRRGFNIELAPADLLETTGARLAKVGRP